MNTKKLSLFVFPPSSTFSIFLLALFRANSFIRSLSCLFSLFSSRALSRSCSSSREAQARSSSIEPLHAATALILACFFPQSIQTMQAPITVFTQGAKRESGKKAQIGNIMAAKVRRNRNRAREECSQRARHPSQRSIVKKRPIAFHAFSFLSSCFFSSSFPTPQKTKKGRR